MSAIARSAMRRVRSGPRHRIDGEDPKRTRFCVRKGATLEQLVRLLEGSKKAVRIDLHFLRQVATRQRRTLWIGADREVDDVVPGEHLLRRNDHVGRER